MQRNLTGVAGIILSLVAFGTSAYHIYTGFFGQPEAYLHRVIHVTLMMLITFMSYSAFSRADDGKVPWYDVVVIGLWFVTMGYLFYEYDWIIEHIGYTEEFAPFQVILAFGAVALTLEACRRAIGWPLAASISSVSTLPRQESALMRRLSPLTTRGRVSTDPHSTPPLSETNPSIRSRARQSALLSR